TTVFDGELSVQSARSTDNGRSATFDVRVGALAGNVTLERDATARTRVLTVETRAGTSVLDFTVEPGTIRVGSETRSGDPHWHAGPRPLATQLAYFLGTASGEDRANDVRA